MDEYEVVFTAKFLRQKVKLIKRYKQYENLFSDFDNIIIPALRDFDFERIPKKFNNHKLHNHNNDFECHPIPNVDNNIVVIYTYYSGKLICKMKEIGSHKIL